MEAHNDLPEPTRRLRSLSDKALLDATSGLLGRSRGLEAELVAHVGEVDARRLYLGEACGSMFVYCTERLHLSAAEAFLRITAARAAREHPPLLAMLADGRLHLSAIARLAPHLTAGNRDDVLQRAVHRSKREILELTAELSPRPDAVARIRRLPVRLPPSHDAAPANTAPVEASLCPERVGSRPLEVPPGRADAPETTASAAEAAGQQQGEARGSAGLKRPDVIEPVAASRYKVQFTASAELRDKLERLRALMRSSVPDGDLAQIVEAAVTEKLARLEARKFARAERPRGAVAEAGNRPSSRQLPAAVRRVVAERDGQRCAYRDAQGRRCTARDRLEFHHRRPYGHGGDHSVDNVALLCRAHNQLIAGIDYGTGARVQRSAVTPP